MRPGWKDLPQYSGVRILDCQGPGMVIALSVGSWAREAAAGD